MIYLTGDTHGNFERIANFCARMNTKPTDIMIILGDAGINFYDGWRDLQKKEYISTLPITLFCIHGNHEQRWRRAPGPRSMHSKKASASAAMKRASACTQAPNPSSCAFPAKSAMNASMKKPIRPAASATPAKSASSAANIWM